MCRTYFFVWVGPQSAKLCTLEHQLTLVAIFGLLLIFTDNYRWCPVERNLLIYEYTSYSNYVFYTAWNVCKLLVILLNFCKVYSFFTFLDVCMFVCCYSILRQIFFYASIYMCSILGKAQWVIYWAFLYNRNDGLFQQTDNQTKMD